MAIELPAAIAGYFAADRAADGSAIMRHFNEDAMVSDEGHTFTGHQEIRRWKAASSAKYIYSAEPVAMAEEAGATIVTAHLTGEFPGSPVDLRYCFWLEGERIAKLEIGA